MSEVVLTSDDGGSLTLGSGVDPFSDGYAFVDFRVAISGAGLSAATQVRTIEGAGGLGAFLAEIANDWKGVEPHRRWESIEHELSIDADRDSLGNVVLTIRLRESYRLDAWEVKSTFRLDAGEEMTAFARAVAECLRC
jgi:hypothetical protein